MKKYSIQVDCANCAAKMESAAKKVPGIADVAVSFICLLYTSDAADE